MNARFSRVGPRCASVVGMSVECCASLECAMCSEDSCDCVSARLDSTVGGGVSKHPLLKLSHAMTDRWYLSGAATGERPGHPGTKGGCPQSHVSQKHFSYD